MVLPFLGGGFKLFYYFCFKMGKIPILTNIFQRGWFNHQLAFGMMINHDMTYIGLFMLEIRPTASGGRPQDITKGPGEQPTEEHHALEEMGQRVDERTWGMPVRLDKNPMDFRFFCVFFFFYMSLQILATIMAFLAHLVQTWCLRVNTPQRSQAQRQRHMGNRFAGEASKGFRELCHVALRFECHPLNWERKQKNNKNQPRNQGKVLFLLLVVCC